MKINIERLVEFFDSRNPSYRTHVTAIIGLIGEDLNSALFADYLNRTDEFAKAQVLGYQMSTGRLKGPRLDRWILADKILYQSEIKNWCSFAIGGYTLSLSAPDKEVQDLARKYWRREKEDNYENCKEYGRVSKVLASMNIPADFNDKKLDLRPLLIHWMPISSRGLKPFFSVPVRSLGLDKRFTKQIKFKCLYYFSCSLYLRELIKKGYRFLNLDLPNYEKRVNLLKSFLIINKIKR
jgi:hypothetical protein